MGCGLSDLHLNKSRRRAMSDDEETINHGSGISREKSKVKIHHAKEVRLLPSEPKVVFIFGGPGSKKGTIVNELISSFGFHLINAEKIILQKLMQEHSDDCAFGESSMAVRNLLREQPELVSLDWVMLEIIREIDHKPRGFYLVDILPNLKVLLKTNGLTLNVPQEMSKLEKKYPVSFVINLDKTVMKRPSMASEAQNQKITKTEEPQQSDEADFSRTEKRFTLHANSIKPYLDYFKKAENLITVDASCGRVDTIWAALRDNLKCNEMQTLKSINTVIYFAFTTDEYNYVNDTYIVNSLCIKDYLDPGEVPSLKSFNALCHHINRMDYENRTFLIDMSNMECNLDSFIKSVDKKPVLFFEVTNSVLKKHMYCRNRDTKTVKEVKTVISTENEVYLFPKNTNSALCKKIASCFTYCREDL